MRHPPPRTRRAPKQKPCTNIAIIANCESTPHTCAHLLLMMSSVSAVVARAAIPARAALKAWTVRMADAARSMRLATVCSVARSRPRSAWARAWMRMRPGSAERMTKVGAQKRERARATRVVVRYCAGARDDAARTSSVSLCHYRQVYLRSCKEEVLPSKLNHEPAGAHRPSISLVGAHRRIEPWHVLAHDIPVHHLRSARVFHSPIQSALQLVTLLNTIDQTARTTTSSTWRMVLRAVWACAGERVERAMRRASKALRVADDEGHEGCGAA